MHWTTLEDNGKPMRNEGEPPNPLENHWKTIGKQRTSNENKGTQMKTIGEHWKTLVSTTCSSPRVLPLDRGAPVRAWLPLVLMGLP